MLSPNVGAEVSEVAWVAGFYSGEGSTVATSNRDGRRYVNLLVGNTDIACLLRCQAVIGGKVYGPYGRREPGRKPMAVLKVQQQEMVDLAWSIISPYMSTEKLLQMQEARAVAQANRPVDPLAAWRTRRERHGATGGNRPRALTPQPCRREHELSHRYEYTNPAGRTMWKCRECQRESDRDMRARRKK